MAEDNVNVVVIPVDEGEAGDADHQHRSTLR
jgi:hypothetical protein